MFQANASKKKMNAKRKITEEEGEGLIVGSLGSPWGVPMSSPDIVSETR